MSIRVCDRCGTPVMEYVPLNAVPRNMEISVPFELKRSDWCVMKPCVLCKHCVQSFFDWWREGVEKGYIPKREPVSNRVKLCANCKFYLSCTIPDQTHDTEACYKWEANNG